MINFFCKPCKSEKEIYIWNSLAALLNSGQSILLLMIVSRIDPVHDAGIFTIAYAVANLAVMVGRYGVRQYQSSDLQEKYSFQEYFCARIVSVAAMLCLCVGYVGLHLANHTYSLYKCMCVLLICFVRLIDAAEDVVHGFFQQHSRLDCAAKIQTVRYIIYICIFAFVYIGCRNMLEAIVWAAGVNAIIAFVLNWLVYRRLRISSGMVHKNQVKNLLIECFPLFGATFLSTYLGNAPKYAIDTVLSDTMQAEFNYIFMPVFVITLMSMFIYQPMIVKYALYWKQKDIVSFRKSMKFQSRLLLTGMVMVLIGGYFLGIPVLSLVFGVDLTGFREQLLILILGGSMLAFVNYFTMLITVIRKQNWLLSGYAAAAVVFFFFGKKVAVGYGTEGVAVFYAIVLLLLAVYARIILLKNIKANRKI